ncbi:MAG TPA: glutathione S-transferase family protein [Arenibaculum sp.]|nr:glutathione S-transferase family protein [Arenibaculum sp.]
MADVTLYGVGFSTYVRTCRLALCEKGVEHRLVEHVPGSPEQRAVQPFGKVPALRHGEFTLYESPAICRYVDEAFDGPALQPGDARARAVMMQWIGIFRDYLYAPVVKDVIIPRLVLKKPVDEARAAAGAARAAEVLELVERHLARSPWFAGTEISLADFFFVPATDYLRLVPEAHLLASRPNLTAWFERMSERPSMARIGIPTALPAS